MKILVLILASEGYEAFEKSWRGHLSTAESCTCFFYKSDPNQTDLFVMKGDTLFIKLAETLENVWQKTLLAFQYFEPQLHEYDFVLRPNMSTVVLFDRYLATARLFPKTECCAAYVGWRNHLPFPAGNAITLSPDLVRRIVRDPPPCFVMDDVTIGMEMIKYGIQLIHLPRIDNPDRVFCPLDCHQIRLKTENRIHDAALHHRFLTLQNAIDSRPQAHP
jgi:hypothetical protein